MIPRMIEAWENGNKVVCMVKTTSKENKLVYFAREVYYRIFCKMSRVKQIRQFTGFGLYDRSFIKVLRTLHDATPFTKGIVAEYAPEHMEIEYEQQRRKEGKSSLNFFGYYNSAMLSFTTYTKTGIRIGVFAGSAFIGGSVAALLILLICKAFMFDSFSIHVPALACAIMLLYGFLLLMIGLVGEYAMSINTRVIDRPMVVVEERLNFDDENNR